MRGQGYLGTNRHEEASSPAPLPFLTEEGAQRAGEERQAQAGLCEGPQKPLYIHHHSPRGREDW